MSWVDDVQRAVREGVNQGLAEIAQDVVDTAAPIIAREAIDLGDLLKSGEVQRVDESTWAAVWTANHAPFVEYGTKPHWPPEAPIRAWVERNMRVENVVGPKGPQRGGMVIKPRLKKGTRDPREAEIDRMTFLVRRKIAMKGTEPVRFAYRAARKAEKRASDKLSRAITRRLLANANRTGRL